MNRLAYKWTVPPRQFHWNRDAMVVGLPCHHDERNDARTARRERVGPGQDGKLS